MGSYLSMVKSNINLHELNKINKINELNKLNKLNELNKFNKYNKFNEPLKYNVNIIKTFAPKLNTIYE